MPPKKKTNATASTATATAMATATGNVPGAFGKRPPVVAPPAPPPPAAPISIAEKLTLAQMQAKIASITLEKTTNASFGKQLDDKLTRAFKNAPKRPNITIDAIEQEMQKLELRRNTTSMSLNDEKYILRELQLLQEKKKQVADFELFQNDVETMKQERNTRFTQNKKFDQQLQQLQQGIRKAALAEKLAISFEKEPFVTLEMDIPEDKMGLVVGKSFTMLRKIEDECHVLLDTEPKSTLLKITSTSANVTKAKEMIENITLATSHSFGLHPDTIKVLMAQKAKHLHDLEAKHGLKIDLNKTDGTLTTLAAPAKAKQLQNALQELEASKVEIQLPSEIVPKLIGKKGEIINQLMEKTGCVVEIDKITNSVKLCGAKESVSAAKQFVLQLIDQQSQQERVFDVSDKTFFNSEAYLTHKFHFFAEFLMSNKGHQLKLLRSDAMDARVKVDKETQTITVLGTKMQLEAMENALKERIAVFETNHWVYEMQDLSLLSLIIGKKGATIKQMESDGKTENVKIEIHGKYVCVFGDSQQAIATAKQKIMEIIEKNQKSFFMASSHHLIAILFTNKRAKLNEIESTSNAKLQVPPASSGPVSGASSGKIKITLTGTLEAITDAKSQLERLEEIHLVTFLPLDDDEVATVIGKKGETISELEKKSGVRLRVLRGDASGPGTADKETKETSKVTKEAAPAELEMVGTQEQLEVVQKEIDLLLQTSNRKILQLDPFATSCLIGKKGERIKTLRVSHPEATVDAFPARGYVRIKASSDEALQKCVDHVLQVLRETLVVESVKVPHDAKGSVNFNTILEKNPSIAARLEEMEAEGGENTKVSLQEDGKLAKIRGPAMSIGALKRFLEMLVSLADEGEDARFVETIALPSHAFGSVLLAKAQQKEAEADATHKLNENALRICKLTGCEIRVKKQPVGAGAGAGASGPVSQGAIVIEGSNPSKVYDAKDQVQKIIHFYHGECIETLDKLPQAALPRLYELLPSLRGKYNVVFSLPNKTSLRVFTDSKKATKEVIVLLKKELIVWKKQHVELPIPSWLVPVLVGKSGETIKKLSAESNNAKLDLSPASSASPSSSSSRGQQQAEDRVLTVSARDDATVALAVAKIHEFIQIQQNRTTTLDVDKSKLDLVLSAKKETPPGVQLYVATGKTPGIVQVVVYAGDHEAREAVIEKLEHLVATSVLETIALPAQAATGSIVGALIGKSGANIKALQKEFPQVHIDIKREDNSITLKGPRDEVGQVKNVMEDKVRELLRQQEAYEERNRQFDEERRQQRRGGGAGAVPEEGKTKGEGDETKDKHSDEVDENTKPQQQHQRPATGPVGGSGVVDESKLTKNQRRRLRKRAENEKSGDVLSMIMGGGGGDAQAAADDDDSGYYHSTSGYKLRL